ncbi:hypothetical protein H0H92_002296, partial [Tricholoma furcatifolium]
MAKSNRSKAPQRSRAHDTHQASPVDVNAPRRTRNQRKAGDFELPAPAAPRPQPRRRAPRKPSAVIDDPFIIQ